MTLIRKKVLILGAFGVGKTSLVRRFVSDEFSEDYLSTIGVHIEQHQVALDSQQIQLLIWDIAGEDEFSRLQSAYFRGASGVIFVADATRSWTVEKIQEMRNQYSDALSQLPFSVLVNKCDLHAAPDLQQTIEQAQLDQATYTSAKLGTGVAASFTELARKMIEK